VKYITDTSDYAETLDRLSPYHVYMHYYWRLRGRWRKQLYDWVRRAPCDATASLAPRQVLAGERATVTLTVRIGATPLRRNGRVAIYFPMSFGGFSEQIALRCFQGPDGQTGYGSRITADASTPGTRIAVQVHTAGAVFLCVELIIEEGELHEGDEIVVLVGDPSCKPQVINERAKSLPMRIALDCEGDGTFRPIVPNPEITVVGNRAKYLRCFAPGTPEVGKPFDVRVVAADLENHNPDHHHSGTVELRAVEGLLEDQVAAEMPATARGTLAVPGVIVGHPGVTRIEAVDHGQGLMGVTNPVCPEMAVGEWRVYYGEIHSHTELSDGVGAPEDSYRWARDAEGLDFAGLADHFEDGQSYNYTLEDKWRRTREVTERFHDPGRFVTLLGYEIGTLEAHRNVHFADAEGRMIVEGAGGDRVTMDNVFAKLQDTDYILIPHAPKFHGINWRRPHDPDRQRLVEICSYWGISEEGGAQSVRHALDLGYKFGFTGGTDNHVAEAGNPDLGGITGVFAASLTRQGIFEALHARRTFATNGPRMILHFFVDDTFMGSELPGAATAPRRVRGRAVTDDPIDTVEVIRNGDVVHSVSGNLSRDVSILWEDAEPLAGITLDREIGTGRFAYYYMRVRTVRGSYGWASPVWVV